MFHITSMHCFHPDGHFDLNEQHLEGLYSYKQPFPVRPTFHIILASIQFQLQSTEYTLTGDNIIIFALCVAGDTVDFVCIGYVSLTLFEPWQKYVQRD